MARVAVAALRRVATCCGGGIGDIGGGCKRGVRLVSTKGLCLRDMAVSMLHVFSLWRGLVPVLCSPCNNLSDVHTGKISLTRFFSSKKTCPCVQGHLSSLTCWKAGVLARPNCRIWAWRVWRLSGRWPDGGLSEGYGHDGPGVCLGDGQTEAERVRSQGGRGDALLRRMLPYLT